VLAGDDQLRVANLSGKTVVILGYAGEPYLRFTRHGVFENLRSPTMYRNRDRWAVTNVPASADHRAAPRWRRLSVAPSYAWHDHRIQWMRRGVLPAVVRAEPRRTHKIFDWSVPGRADGKGFAIKGFLGYAPPPLKPADDDRGRAALWIGAGAGIVVILAAATLVARVRLRRR
jgi:hypothetical protein